MQEGVATEECNVSDHWTCNSLVPSPGQKITSKVELKDNATSPVVIKYYSKCKGTTEKATSECKGLRVGDQVEFRAEITVSCNILHQFIVCERK